MLLYRLLQGLDAMLARVESFLAIAMTGLMTCIMMAQVILRYFFDKPLFWAEEISVQLLVFITLFGISLLVRRGELVCIDFLPRALRRRGRHILALILGLLFLGLLAFMALQGWDWIMRPDVRMEMGATTRLPRWYNYSLLPGAMLAMSLHQCAAVARHVAALFGHEEGRA